MSAAATAETEMVTIPAERLKALEALEANLPNIIANAKKEYDKERLEMVSISRLLILVLYDLLNW